jgi:Ca2+-binding EF-hand superfamily protein
MTDQHVKNVIARFDVNKDDILTVEEVRPFYNELVVERPDLGLSKARCEAWFNTIDQDGDGKIDTAELKSYLAKIKYQG